MISPHELRRILSYDAETGVFAWRQPLNARHTVGSSAGTPTKYGYVAICLRGKKYYAHRLAWLYVTGEWPRGQVDHVNQNKADNSFKNLREASPTQNRVNASARSDNTTGFRGVSWHAQSSKYVVVLGRNRKRHYVGIYANLVDAVAARDAASQRLHGDFSTSYGARLADNARLSC